MRIWIVNHGAERQWLRVLVQTPSRPKLEPRVIYSEWGGPAAQADGYIVPIPPDVRAYPNTDPLVIGSAMFFDYCRKGRKSGPTNLRAPNGLEVGDLVLFGGMRRRHMMIDTVFVVGTWKPWPRARDGIPVWPDLDEIARRVHFHPAAHRKQHPEVHSDRPVPARSFRGRMHEEDPCYFSWVPACVKPERPFFLAPGDDGFRTLSDLYDRPLANYFKTSFPVLADVPEKVGRSIFELLIRHATDAAFDVGVRMDLVTEEGGTSKAHPREGCGSGASPCNLSTGNRR